MARTRIEICIISARGLGRSSSLWKPQWFAVGWIDPNNKYCTKIDSSGSPNPTWKTKFSVPVVDTSLDLHQLSLTIEVYRREPIFLGEKLQGTANILLKEFFAKFERDEALRSGLEGTASFQLRKKNSSKPQGFVDVSIHVFEEKEGLHPHSGLDEGSSCGYSKNDISLAIEDGPVISYPKQPTHRLKLKQSEDNTADNKTNYPYTYPTSSTQSYHPNHMAPLREGSHQRPPTPPPPPPPSHTGFLPTLFPGTMPNCLPDTYINMPATRPSGHAAPHVTVTGPRLGVGLGAGALAAGAVIFGDDFLSGSTLPAGFDDGGSLALSTDSLF